MSSWSGRGVSNTGFLWAVLPNAGEQVAAPKGLGQCLEHVADVAGHGVLVVVVRSQHHHAGAIPRQKDLALDTLSALGENAWQIGTIEGQDDHTKSAQVRYAPGLLKE